MIVDGYLLRILRALTTYRDYNIRFQPFQFPSKFTRIFLVFVYSSSQKLLKINFIFILLFCLKMTKKFYNRWLFRIACCWFHEVFLLDFIIEPVLVNNFLSVTPNGQTESFINEFGQFCVFFGREFSTGSGNRAEILALRLVKLVGTGEKRKEEKGWKKEKGALSGNDRKTALLCLFCFLFCLLASRKK